MADKTSVKVFYADETLSKTLAVDPSTTVEELLTQVAEKIDIKNYKGFGLFSVQDDGSRYREPNEKVKAVLETWNMSQQPGKLVFKRQNYLEMNEENEDPVALKLTFHQVHRSIIDSDYVVTLETAVLLAAYQLLQIYGEKKKAAAGALAKALSTMIPSRYRDTKKSSEWEKLILQAYEKAKPFLDDSEFHHKYLNLAQEEAAYFGYIFYPAIKTGKKEAAFVFAIGNHGVALFTQTEKGREVLHDITFAEISSYSATQTEFNIAIGRQNPKSYSFPTKNGFVLNEILQFFIDVIVKKLVDLEV